MSKRKAPQSDVDQKETESTPKKAKVEDEKDEVKLVDSDALLRKRVQHHYNEFDLWEAEAEEDPSYCLNCGVEAYQEDCECNNPLDDCFTIDQAIERKWVPDWVDEEEEHEDEEEEDDENHCHECLRAVAMFRVTSVEQQKQRALCLECVRRPFADGMFSEIERLLKN